jgi:hypothetical protein
VTAACAILALALTAADKPDAPLIPDGAKLE